MRYAWAWCVGLAAWTAPAVAFAASLDPGAGFAISVDRQTQAQQVRLREDLHERFTVPVTVAGTGPYRFLIDTGAERTVISRELADRLKLERGPSARVTSVASTAVTDTAMVPGIGLGAVDAQPIQSPLFNAASIGADGMLGIDSLKQQRVLIDFKKRMMAISPSSRRDSEQLGDGTIVVHAKSRNGRLILTSASANGRKVKAIVDTGSEITVGNMALRQKLIGNRRKGGEMVEIHAASGETITGEIYVVSAMAISGIDLTDVVVIFADSPVFTSLGLSGTPSLLLGMNVMRAFDRVSIDFAAKTLRFVLPESGQTDAPRFASKGPFARLH
jgi:predicted aspartyl protease